MKATDEAEFREFMAARWPHLVRTAYLLTGDRHLAEDLAQTTLEKAAVSWPRVKSADDTDAYVRRILVNTHLARFRKRRVAEVLSPDLPDGAYGDQSQQIAQRDEVLAALVALPRRQRAAIVLRFWEDLTESQVAGILGCSVGTVRSQTHRALQKLRTSPALAETASERVPLSGVPTGKESVT